MSKFPLGLPWASVSPVGEVVAGQARCPREGRPPWPWQGPCSRFGPLLLPLGIRGPCEGCDSGRACPRHAHRHAVASVVARHLVSRCRSETGPGKGACVSGAPVPLGFLAEEGALPALLARSPGPSALGKVWLLRQAALRAWRGARGCQPSALGEAFGAGRRTQSWGRRLRGEALGILSNPSIFAERSSSSGALKSTSNA